MKKRAEIIRTQTLCLHDAEAQIERAVISVANLTSSLAQARMDARISMVEGVEVMDDLVETLKGLQTARKTIVRAHGGLFDISAKMGYATTAGGGETEKFPESTKPTGHADVVPITAAHDIRQAG